MSEAEGAKRELERSCEDEQLKAELAEIYAMRDDLGVQRSKFEQQAKQCDADAAKLNRKIADADRKADEVRIRMLDP